MNIRRFIALSVALESGIRSDPPGYEPQINYISHQTGAEQMLTMFPGLK